MAHHHEDSKQKVLMVAFHFPPLQGSSGMQRTLGFARHLPDSGWTPIVLAPSIRAYEKIDSRQASLIPEGLLVERSFCLDSARHLAFRGRYLDSLAIPDRWISWLPSAIFTGAMAIWKHRPTMLWSTYPIASTHIIGCWLSRITGTPWVADFRDPLVEKDPRTGVLAPPDPRIRNARLDIEKKCVKHATALVFCTSKARDICLSRYPELNISRCHVISNGYEEHVFQIAKSQLNNNSQAAATADRALTLLHSGTIYPTADRDPGPFFDAVAKLKQSNFLDAKTLQIKLRATGHDEVIRTMLTKRDIDDIVSLLPSIPYTEALTEILSADGLLLFQGYTSNPAIPAKLYEYLRAYRPLLAMTDSEGSTAELLQNLSIGVQAPIEDSGKIADALHAFIQDIRSDQPVCANENDIKQFSRQALSGQLASLFDAISNRNV